MNNTKGIGDGAGSVRHAGQTLTFAYHTVFQVPYVEDAVPVGGPTLCQL